MLSQMLEAWGQPATRHAMIIHFPIVLTVVGVPLTVLAALLTRHRMPVLLTALSVYALLIVTTLLGRWSGEDAHDAISLSDTAHLLLAPKKMVVARQRSCREFAKQSEHLRDIKNGKKNISYRVCKSSS